jgi:uridine monophosphate synthetase
MFTDIKKKLALGLYDIGAIKFGAFRLKLHETKPDAPLSPIYIDLRVLRSFPDVMDSAVSVYADMTKRLKFDIYADVPTAATPIVAILSHETRIPMISPRKDEKQYGTKRPIDGLFHQGEVALLVDDLVTHADSKLEAIAVLEENGLQVHDVVVLVDRQQGGVQELDKRGYSCHVAFRLKELLNFYLESGKINKGEYERTLAYIEKNPN